MKKINVILADDHQLVREGLRLLLENQPDLQVTGEAGNGRELLRLVQRCPADVVIMDLSMPELDGIQATEMLKAALPEVKVIALTVHEDESYLRQLCRAGASGYVLKRSAGRELARCIRAVAAGGLHFDATLAAKALAGQASQSLADRVAPAAALSDREREVLILLAWGYSNKEIAARLEVSVKTVETYRSRIGEKIGLHSRTDMVKYALAQGWLRENEPPPPA